MGFPDLESIDAGWRQCRRRKRGTPQAQRYETRLLDNLVETVQALDSGRWLPARPVCFTVARPKAREIHAADFADRVVHHWLVPRLEALYEPLFIHDVYSNRKGKGTHAAVKRLQAFMHAVQARPGGGSDPRAGYFLQLDVANFFVTVDRRILFHQLQRRLAKAVRQRKLDAAEAHKLRWVCHRMLKQDVGGAARVIATAAEIARVPPHKRLANAPPDKGLPIGNLTSQFFANVYLNELDQFVKHRLKCRHYLRYVDDLVLLHPDPARLAHWHREIAEFLRRHLQLRLRGQSLLAPVTRGIDFLGYIVRPHYLLVRRRVLGNLHEKLRAFQGEILAGPPDRGQGQVLRLDPACLARLRACLASYLGHFRHAHSHRLVASLWRRWPWLGLLLVERRGRLLPLWEPATVTGYRGQVVFFRKRFPHARLAVQCGCESEIYPPWVRRGRRAAEVHPATAMAAMPVGKAPREGTPSLCDRVRQVNVIEDGYLKGGLKRRRIHSLYIQPGVQLCRS